jgi:hypothetical protein
VSVFYYHHLCKRQEAMRMMRAEFQAAIDQIDSICEESYLQVIPIMQSMRDDMERWTDLDLPPDEPKWEGADGCLELAIPCATD